MLIQLSKHFDYDCGSLRIELLFDGVFLIWVGGSKRVYDNIVKLPIILLGNFAILELG